MPSFIREFAGGHSNGNPPIHALKLFQNSGIFRIREYKNAGFMQFLNNRYAILSKPGDFCSLNYKLFKILTLTYWTLLAIDRRAMRSSETLRSPSVVNPTSINP